MAWAVSRKGDYRIMISDGFIDQEAIAKRKRLSPGSPERRVAEELIRSALRQYNQFHPNAGSLNAQIDVWVVGKEGWLSRGPPPPIDAIYETESCADYRILIVGDAADHPPFIAGWEGWIHSAGLRRKKKHLSRKRFQEGTQALMDEMHNYREGLGLPPSPALERLSLPFTHATTYALNRDSAERYRIQQYEIG